MTGMKCHARKRAKDVGRKAQADARTAVLDALQLKLDVEALKNGLKATGQKIKVDEIRLQITWHRRHDGSIQSNEIISSL